MQLVEQHCIRKDDPRYAVIDEAAFQSKNLYNTALYEMRQVFFNEGRYLKYEEIQRRMQPHEAYKALPAHERVKAVPSQRGPRARHETNGTDHQPP
jgi:putative transposase